MSKKTKTIKLYVEDKNDYTKETKCKKEISASAEKADALGLQGFDWRNYVADSKLRLGTFKCPFKNDIGIGAIDKIVPALADSKTGMQVVYVPNRSRGTYGQLKDATYQLCGNVVFAFGDVIHLERIECNVAVIVCNELHVSGEFHVEHNLNIFAKEIHTKGINARNAYIYANDIEGEIVCDDAYIVSRLGMTVPSKVSFDNLSLLKGTDELIKVAESAEKLYSKLIRKISDIEYPLDYVSALTINAINEGNMTISKCAKFCSKAKKPTNKLNEILTATAEQTQPSQNINAVSSTTSQSSNTPAAQKATSMPADVRDYVNQITAIEHKAILQGLYVASWEALKHTADLGKGKLAAVIEALYPINPFTLDEAKELVAASNNQ